MELYWARSEEAIAETAAKYGAYCHAVAYGILSDEEDAQECVSDTYFGAWNSMPPHRPALLRTYLGKITRRVSLKKWRDKGRAKRGGGQVPLTLGELEDCVPSPLSVEEAVAAKELGAALSRFVAGLPETERRVFLRRYWYFDPIEDICKSFGFSAGKVKSMLFRTRARLRDFLQKEGF
ncbi:MAG TPA: sigma-70 family RNA polymerase sigma factor [Terriglobales bacterium]|nr:sigma-70 family RNA polymerase sigma factor [Terriglobales bacterium]